jgi:predicted TIM-barrel fold metal-dependent hydrolase
VALRINSIMGSERDQGDSAMRDKRPASPREGWTRRGWLTVAGTTLIGAGAGGHAVSGNTSVMPPQPPSQGLPLRLTEFQPKSMLHVTETRVERARFPVIDFHSHVSWKPAQHPRVPPAELVKTMDAVNLHTMVNLTGGWGDQLASTIRDFDRAFPRRFVSMTEPAWTRAGETGYAAWQADEIGKAKAAGAVGLKILKTLGLYLRDGGPTGTLVRVDDERFDPMWDACGRLGLPVAMHVGDPEAFFLPIDRFNERYEELGAHPDWSFYGKDFPGFRDILSARDRVFARHPKTTFVALHVGHWAENLAAVGEMLDKYPNVNVEIAARIGELGRQPRTATRFFDRYQDRVLFGTDAIPLGVETPQQVFGEDLYRIYYRFLETHDEYFDYAPAAVPPQGRWRIYGLGLPEQILRKVYYANAQRVLGMTLVQG